MTRARIIASFLMLLVGAAPASAHEVRPAYLELRQTGAGTYDVLWKVPAQGEELRFGLYVRLPEDCANSSTPRGWFAAGAYTERWSVRCQGGLSGRTIGIDGLAASATDVLVRLERLDHTTQVTRVVPAAPFFVVEDAPRTLEVAGTYLVLGVEHILFGIDHLLFVLALLLIVNGYRQAVGTISAFTLAHSITLAGATLGLVHVPAKPVEACIALSIVFVAVEIVHGYEGHPGLTARRPWIVAFIFGLLHGFGFAGALSEVGLPQRAIPVALLFFNLGVELGQLLFIAAVACAAVLVRRLHLRWPRWAELVPPYAIGTTAMVWVIERLAAFAT